MAQNSKSPLTVAIAANFSAQEIRDSLSLWLNTLDIEANIVYCPHDSIIQQLLDRSSALATADYAVILLGMEKWCCRDRTVSGDVAVKNFATFSGAIRAAIESFTAFSVLIVSCPIPSDFYLNETLITIESNLVRELGSLPNVDYISNEALLTLYPPGNYRDYFTDNSLDLEDCPYSQLCFATLGTLVARRIYSRFHTRCKVIVVDCDNTLWSGVCGEKGPMGITVDDGNRALQEFLIRQLQYGRLLCLCSKNHISDVMAVFDQNPAMLLKLEHITASRINWQSKPSNLSSLADELHVGLDSFVFLDDDAFECASVTTFCPDVRTIRIPQNNLDLCATLDHVWELDKPAITVEDQKRNLYYRQNIQRERAQAVTPSLDQFLESLDLTVTIQLLDAKELPRAMQLMQRVNQFNLNGARLSAVDLIDSDSNRSCYVVRALDRFGDYGLVGLVVCGTSPGVLKVHTLLLSCRALGRGVEARLSNYLEAKARRDGCATIEFDYFQTSRNSLILTFLLDLGATNVMSGGSNMMIRTLALPS